MKLRTVIGPATNMTMKIRMIICLGLAAGLLAGCESEKGERGEKKEHEQAKLMAEAKVSKDAAEQTALTRVPNGTLKEAELEKEKGKLIWSFGFTTPDTENIIEVNVDAINGDVVNVETETPEKENKEAAEGKDSDKN
jgi:hypothetical protein